MRQNSNIFERNVPGTTALLQKAVVGIAGCGGLGSNAAVALVRAGVGRLILADFDQVELSNLNRQYYFRDDAGRDKVDALAGHLRAINPDIKLDLHRRKLTPRDIPEIFAPAGLLIEAFDRAESKHWLIESWCRAFPRRHLICASGVSGKGATSAIKIRSSGYIHLVGDEQTDISMGLCSARVAIAANMQANIAIDILTTQKDG
ncbi:MAG: sulfur carrier protein ThiS adenylyltransferase ThiF [Candidatus Krumholzibacteriota bacterium]|nr:sulfur carrier protein ThiS adenylyltransferase ThiF [Candidatus Krumholzibacteriota bacterium]